MDRRDNKALRQEEKLKRLLSLPMLKQLKPRLKRESFTHIRTLQKFMDISTEKDSEQVTVANPWPAWKRKHQIDILETTYGIESKSSMNTTEIRKKLSVQ